MASGFRKGDRAKARALFRKVSPTVRKHVAKALADNAEDLSEAIRGRVPKDTGDLAQSVGWERGRRAGNARDGDAQRDLSVTVFEGDDASFYGPFVEFGTKDQPARPHFYPTYRQKKRALKARLSRAVTLAVKELQK
ncbi:MAG: HK97 gp10 family phage protein [Brevundimonas sp.]|nr:MAG: HK97 gp10 family phage protein [Brevundimonas sp.]